MLLEGDYEFELLIMEDGSIDKTFEIAKTYSKRYSNIHVFHSKERLGKGNAIKRGFNLSNGEYIIFIDADLPVNLSAFPKLIEGLEKGHSIVIGSRYHPESMLNRTIYKTLKSKLYNYLINLIFNTKLSDHQCGFKAFKRSDINKIIDDIQDNAFFFDTELLVKAKKADLSIIEIPIVWTDSMGRISNISFKEELRMLVKYIQFVFEQK